MNEPAPSPPAALPAAPAPWTPAFHLRFVPALIAHRLRPPPPQGGFAPHFDLVVPVATVFAFVLLAVGIDGLEQGSTVIGGGLALLGGGGLLALVVVGIVESRGTPRTWERFSLPLFAFSIFTGLAAGTFLQRLAGVDWPPTAAAASIAGGALAGYLVGLLLGYWWQALGAFGILLAAFAWAGSVGMIVLTLVLLSG